MFTSQSALQESDNGQGLLKKENEKLRVQVDDLIQKQQSRKDMEDEVMVAVNAKVEEWKVLRHVCLIHI